jgi:hypothetical protein
LPQVAVAVKDAKPSTRIVQTEIGKVLAWKNPLAPAMTVWRRIASNDHFEGIEQNVNPLSAISVPRTKDACTDIVWKHYWGKRTSSDIPWGQSAATCNLGKFGARRVRHKLATK